MTTNGTSVRLDFRSAFDMLDFVQVVCDHVGRMSGLDEDSLHWVSVAVRESVINAIKHGNGNDEQKRVFVEFTPLHADAAGLSKLTDSITSRSTVPFPRVVQYN